MCMAIIEVETSGGTWMRIGDCSKNPETYKAVIRTNAKSNSKWKKFRVLDGETKQMIDFQIIF